MIENILIIKMSAIGDVIHALPVAHALKSTFQKAKITWIVEKPAYDLVSHCPSVDQVILFDKKKFKSLNGLMTNMPSLSKELKQCKFDVALDLQGLFKSAAIAYLSGAATKLGYCNMRELSGLVSRPICGDNQNNHVVERYLDVARSLGCKVAQGGAVFNLQVTEQEVDLLIPKVSQVGLDIKQPYAILAPGTNWVTKCWPGDSFAILADLLYEAGIIPVIAGAPNDQKLAERIIERTKIPPVNIVGRTSLVELAHLLKYAKTFVGGDTGPMHLAAAVGTPVVALFGPTDPNRNGPYPNNHVKHQVIQADISCRNCWRRVCEKHCMDKIQPERVFAAVKEVIG